MTNRPELDRLLERARRYVDAMTPEQKAAMIRAQAESWVRAEMAWPKPRFKYVDGVKVFESYEDYLND